MSQHIKAPSERPPSQLSELTSLRFFAAFAVLVLHYRDLLGPLPDWVLSGIVGGQYGVTFFFILSGFILTYRYQDWFAAGVSDTRYWRFQRFRVARIYPIYVLGLLLDTPWHLLERAQVGQLTEAAPLYWASWLMNLVGLQAWVPTVPFAMFWNTPAWSVAAEFFFYATFPFLCARLSSVLRFGPGAGASWGRLVLLLLGVTLLGVAAYALVIHVLTAVIPVSSDTQYIVLVYNPLLRYSEFLAGCVAGHFFLQQQRDGVGQTSGLFGSHQRRNVVLLLCLAVIVTRVWMPAYTGPSASLWLIDVALKYGVFVLPFSLLILAVASGRTCLSWFLERPLWVALGEASYALYIIHWSVTTFLRLGYLGSWGTPVVHVFFMFATIWASVLCHRFIEVPWRERLRGT